MAKRTTKSTRTTKTTATTTNTNLTQIMTAHNEIKLFSEHFARIISIDSLIKDFSDDPKLFNIFADIKYGQEILSFSNLADQFEIILTDVFTDYTNAVLKKHFGYIRRIGIFKDLLTKRLEKAPGGDIAATIGDFTKSRTGKYISDTLDNLNITDDINRVYIPVLIGIRTHIIESLGLSDEAKSEYEEYLAEQNKVVDANNEVTTKVTSAARISKDTNNNGNCSDVFTKAIESLLKDSVPEFDTIISMISNMGNEPSSDDIKCFAKYARPILGDSAKLLNTIVGNMDMNSINIATLNSISSIVEGVIDLNSIPDKNSDIISNAALLVTALCDGMATGKDLSLNKTFYAIMSEMVYLIANYAINDNDKSLYDILDFVYKLLEMLAMDESNPRLTDISAELTTYVNEDTIKGLAKAEPKNDATTIKQEETTTNKVVDASPEDKTKEHFMGIMSEAIDGLYGDKGNEFKENVMNKVDNIIPTPNSSKVNKPVVNRVDTVPTKSEREEHFEAMKACIRDCCRSISIARR